MITDSPPTLAARSHLATKTRFLVEKYGPGPKVHYHIGLFRDVETDTTASDLTLIRRHITAAQEALVSHAAQVWDAKTTLAGNIIDIGCGLGGGSIYWAQECGATVTAVTNVVEHIPIISQFVSDAGLPTSRVTPVLADAAGLPDGLSFDGAVAMESMCYMPRARVFAGLSKMLKSGSALCVQDVFLSRPEWKKPFDAYWKTDVGTVDEYLGLATQTGFELTLDEDVTDETTEFWLQSMAWTELKLGRTGPDHPEYQQLMQSMRWHGNFYRCFRDNGINVKLLKFRKQKDQEREEPICGGP